MRSHRRPVLALAGLAACLALTGCGSDDTDVAADGDAVAVETPSPTPERPDPQRVGR